jgi:AcrR family transcriptional regulator
MTAADRTTSARPLVDDAIVEASRRALARDGLAHATLERIAEEAGLSRVTLYRRGVTREVILAAVADRIVDECRAGLWGALTARGSGAARLRRGLSAVCEVVERSREPVLALSEPLGAGDGSAARQAPPFARCELTEPLERLLRDGAADGSLRHVDAPEAAVALLNLVAWMYVHLRTGARRSARRARALTLDLALHGVAAERRQRGRQL